LSDPSAAPAADDASDDLGAVLEANYDKVVGGESDSPATPAPSAPAAAAVPPSSSPEGAAADAARARGPDGKFVKGEPAKPAAPADAAAPAAAPGAPEFKIPEKWPADVKDRLQKIHAVNPEHAQFVLEQYSRFRQIDATREGQIQAKLKAFDDLLAPGRQQRALQNMDDTTYVRQLIAAGDVLDKNPEQGLKWLADRYGIDLQKLANPDASGQQQPVISPEIRAIQEENARIKAYLEQKHQAEEQESLQRAGDWISQFAAQKDAQGQLVYPHFDAVIHDIVFVVQQQLAQKQQVDVKAAYDKAVRLNDAIWLKEQESAKTKSAEADKARRLRAIEDAKKAGFTVSGSGAAPSTDVPDDLGAHLDRNYDKFVRS
jgi:hypothetical protein